MDGSIEQLITITSAIITLLLLIFAVDWQYFRDWVVLFFFKVCINLLWGSLVVKLNLLVYPVRLLPTYYDTSILFECWVFPVLCILYNQATREKGIWPIIYYALLFSAGMTAIEYPLELYTNLITYINWTWFTTFYTLTSAMLLSRFFIAFFRWGCDYFSNTQFKNSM